MTVVHRTGNIFTTDLPAIGHGVNTKGVMGAGIAKTIRANFPDVYSLYRDYCQEGRLKPGDVFPAFSVMSNPNRWIFNIASQNNTGPDATYEWVEMGMAKALVLAKNLGLSGLALPRIASGIGGLEWDLVEPIMTAAADLYPNLIVELWEFKA